MKEISNHEISVVSGGCPPCAVVAVVSLLETAATYAGAGATIYGAYRFFAR